jgi:hypothetical protein
MKSEKSLEENYSKPKDPSSVHEWIQNVEGLSLPLRGYLKKIYFLVDNIE